MFVLHTLSNKLEFEFGVIHGVGCKPINKNLDSTALL